MTDIGQPLSFDLIDTLPRQPGVYLIRNVVNQKSYVGSAVNLRKRLQSHRWYLGTGNHGNPHLQSSWNHYGASGFVLHILNVLEPSGRVFLRQLESDWVNLLETNKEENGYNLTPPLKGIGVDVAESTRQKIVAANRGRKQPASEIANRAARLRGRTLSPEHREKIGMASRGRRHSEESKRKMSEARKGVKFSDERRQKMSLAQAGRAGKRSSHCKYGHPLFGDNLYVSPSGSRGCKECRRQRNRDHWQEHLSPAAHGVRNRNIKQWKVTDPDGNVQVIQNLTEFCRSHGLSFPAMYQVSTGHQKQHRGWLCQRLEDESS